MESNGLIMRNIESSDRCLRRVTLRIKMMGL
jgi:hypothetical protein